MSINYAQVKLNEYIRELESLTNFKHDNTYVHRLIAERIEHLDLEIKSCKNLLN